MQRVVVLNVVGLTPRLLRHAPTLRRWAESRGGVTPLRPVLPAVTCSVQASMLTGLEPGVRAATPGPGGGLEQAGTAAGVGAFHGVVGNGWYHRNQAEVRFWQRSDRLVRGEKLWDTARRRDASGRFTCANLFWWHNTYSSCDVALQARPIYCADGRKVPDVYCNLPELREALQRPRRPCGLGRFPLFNFWGPAAGLASSRWIASAARRVEREMSPTLQLVYLPHLDYDLQRFGPEGPEAIHAVAEVDGLVGELLHDFESRGVRPLVVSEYGIEQTAPGGGAVMVNRTLRERGLLAVRNELGRELLDPGASEAFAVTDHQVAHVYLRPGSRRGDEVRACCEGLDGVARVDAGRTPRAGDLVLEAGPGRWFAYDYWPADRPGRAPDFARTVDIHRKPGYDPRELLLDPAMRWPRAAVAWRLMVKRLGFRRLMDVVPLDPSGVNGTHGRADLPTDRGPLLLGFDGTPFAFKKVETGEPDKSGGSDGNKIDRGLPCTAVKEVVLEAMGLPDPDAQAAGGKGGLLPADRGQRRRGDPA